MGDVFQRDRDPVARRDHRLFEIRDGRHIAKVADQKLALSGNEVAAGGIQVCGTDGGFDIVQGQAVLLQAVPLDQHLILGDATADGGHLRDSRDRQQTGAQRPVCQRADLERRASAAADDPDQHDFAHQRGDRSDGGHHSLGQVSSAELQPFGDDLAIDVDVGVPVELHEQEGETGSRRGTDPLHVGGAVHQRLERQRDQGLDFLRRQTGRLGEDRDDRAVQIRKDVDVQARYDQDSVHQNHGGERDDEQPIGEGEPDDPIQHSASLGRRRSEPIRRS